MEENPQKTKEPSIYKDYLVQTIPAVIAFVGGIVFGYGTFPGHLSGTILFILMMASSIYCLRKFDARPDITKARKEISMYSKEIQNLKKDFEELNINAKEAKENLNALKTSFLDLAYRLEKAQELLGRIDAKANASFFTSLIGIFKDAGK
jgi:hypothetical protein